MQDLYLSEDGRMRKDLRMQNDPFLILRVLAGVIFLGAILGGGYMLRNRRALFGANPDVPSENSSDRSYRNLMIILVWAHIFFISGAFALSLH